MRIVHIESGQHLYGGGAQVRYLLEGLHAAHVENVLICAQGSALAGSAGAALPSTQIVALPMGGDLDLRLYARLKRALAALRPDIVHVHSRRGAELFGAWASAAQRLPAVITRRVDSPEPAFWARFKYRPYRAVIAISRAIETQLTTQGVHRARVHRIASAVDTQRYQPDATARARVLEAFGLRDDALVVAVVAQLIPRKGHALLFAQLPQLVARHPQLNVLCFGQGPLEAQLRAQIAALGLTPHVQLAGFRRDLAALLPGVDLLVHPASREGLGVALLEALSCAVPVIACAAGGVVDVFRDDVHGLMVPVNDGVGLRRALERLLGDSAARQRLGAAGRLHVQNHFSIAQMVAGHLQVYRHAVV
jgi:glycosyltransferase involved in cell wall biosynthesis